MTFFFSLNGGSEHDMRIYLEACMENGIFASGPKYRVEVVNACNRKRARTKPSSVYIYSQQRICWVSIYGGGEWWRENARLEKPEQPWNLAGTLLGTLPEPCWNLFGTLLEPCWNLCGTLPELCRNLVVTPGCTLGNYCGVSFWCLLFPLYFIFCFSCFVSMLSCFA